MMKTRSAVLQLCAGVPIAALVCGCLSHHVETEPIEIKPIHITMDINLRVQRELDEFFDFEKSTAPGGSPTIQSKERP